MPETWGPPSCSWLGSPWSRRGAGSIFTPLDLCQCYCLASHSPQQLHKVITRRNGRNPSTTISTFINKFCVFIKEQKQNRGSLYESIFFSVSFSFYQSNCRYLGSQIFGCSNMAVMTIFLAHDTKASLPVRAWQDRPTNSKPLCLAASPSRSFCCPKGLNFPFPLQANTSWDTVRALTS